MKKIFIMIILGFAFSNTQYSIGVDLKREISTSDYISSYDISGYMNGVDVKGFTLGLERIKYLGKRKNIDLGFEYSMSTTRSFAETPSSINLNNITMSMINFYSKWNFINTDKFDFFLKIGHTELLNYNIEGQNMATRSGLLSFGLGVTYNNKIRFSYDSSSFSAYNNSENSTDISHSGSVIKMNLAYLF